MEIINKEKMEIPKEVKKIIEKNPVALATINEERKPYAIAVAFVKVKDNKIIITNNYMNNTIKNISNNKNVSLVVWDKKMHGYQINGTAEHFESGEWYDFVKSFKENKDEPCKGALVIELNSIKKLA